MLHDAARCTDFQANSYWVIIGSKDRRAALAECCIRAKSPSWETTPDVSTRSALSTTGRHCVQAWKHRQCFWGGEHWPLPPVIHQLSLPPNNPCVVSHGLPKDVFSHGWHTEAKRPLHLWPPIKLLQERRGSACVGALIWVLTGFFLQPKQSRVPPFWGNWLCRVLKQQHVSSACGNAWRGSEVIIAGVLSSTRNSAIDFALFSCHQAESRLCFSKSCIRKISAEDLLHLHILFRELTGLAKPDVVGQYQSSFWLIAGNLLFCQALTVLRENEYCARFHTEWVQFYKSALVLGLLEPEANEKLNEQYCYLTMHEIRFKQHKACVLGVLSVDSVMKLFAEEHSLSFSQMTRNAVWHHMTVILQVLQCRNKLEDLI